LALLSEDYIARRQPWCNGSRRAELEFLFFASQQRQSQRPKKCVLLKMKT